LGEASSSRSNVVVDVHADGEEWTLPAEVQIGLYRIVQEALNNTGKHASASHVGVHVRWTASAIALRVQDDGRGFDAAAIPPGRLGLGIMHERARSIGARLRMESQPGAGTRVTVRWRRV
jgi:signal transduction histidine kinase